MPFYSEKVLDHFKNPRNVGGKRRKKGRFYFSFINPRGKRDASIFRLLTPEGTQGSVKNE